MALETTRVQRNLRARMLWFRFEVEDLILLGILWAAAQLMSNFIHRTMFGVPAEVVMPWIVVILTYIGIRLFKYNRPPAYLWDLLDHIRLPKIWCACEPDPVEPKPYLREDL
jgi:hypothetical protein